MLFHSVVTWSVVDIVFLELGNMMTTSMDPSVGYSYVTLTLHFHSMGLFLYREILCYPTPINFNYWYGIGLLLVFLLVNQVLTGIQVGSYYIVSIDVALSSVDYLMREITYGWSFRYLHSNGAY